MSLHQPPPLISEPKYPHLCLVTLNKLPVKDILTYLYVVVMFFLSLLAWSSQSCLFYTLLCVWCAPYVVWYCVKLYKDIVLYFNV